MLFHRPLFTRAVRLNKVTSDPKSGFMEPVLEKLGRPCLFALVCESDTLTLISVSYTHLDVYKRQVLYITHDLATAYYISDRIAIMLRGDVVEFGNIDKVMNKLLQIRYKVCCRSND